MAYVVEIQLAENTWSTLDLTKVVQVHVKGPSPEDPAEVSVYVPERAGAVMTLSGPVARRFLVAYRKYAGDQYHRLSYTP